MLQNAPIIAMQFVGIVGALTIVTCMISANMYDIKNTNRRRGVKQQTTYRRRPLVTIVIHARAGNDSLSSTLDSIRRNGYRKIECIVTENASGVHARRITAAYAKQHESLPLFCLTKKKLVSKQQLLTEAINRFASGEVVVWLQAGDTLERGMIRQFVTRLERSNTAIIRPRIVMHRQRTLGSTLKTYQQILDNTLCKSLSVLHAGYGLSERGIASADLLHFKPNQSTYTEFVYDISIVDGTDWSLGRFYLENFRRTRLYYRSLLTRISLAFERSTKSMSRLLLPFTILQAIAGLLLPVLLCYFVYLALYLLQPMFLAVSVMIAVVLLLYCIWGEYSVSFLTRLRLSIGIPLTFIAYFVLSFVPIIALLGSPADIS